MSPKLELLLNECKLIEENCTYNAQIHFMLAERKSYQSRLLMLIPAVVTAVAGTSVALGGPSWLGWLGLVAGVASAFATMLAPEKQSQDHLNIAKDFTNLKHDARALREVYYQFLSEKELYQHVRPIGQRYNHLVSNAPLATNLPFMSNKKVYLEAKKWVQAGTHRPDFKEGTDRPVELPAVQQLNERMK